MTRSIAATLLLWYALILVAVIGAFGALLHEHRRRSAYDAVDAEIAAHAGALAATVEWEPGEGLDLEYAAEYVRRLDGEAGGTRWALVTDREGGVLARSAAAPAPGGPPVPGARVAGDLREVVVEGPAGTRVLVGRSTAAVREELAEFLGAVVAAGAATLLVALAGGWFLVARVLRPIRRMTEAAERISESRPSERIDVGGTESELGRLATTLNRAFDRLGDALERRTRFTADASHELRTPVSIVVSNAEASLRRDRSSEEYRTALAVCLRAGRRMAEIVDDLLLLARADAGKLVLDRRPTALAPVVEEAVASLEAAAQERDVSVATRLAPATVAGDAERLRSVVENLVSNAIRYNRAGGRVEVVLASEGEEAVLTVADTGAGIPEAARSRVFERFFRVDEARSREHGGSGLGLPIAKRIVEAHGGRIELASEVGAGTRVTVRIPSVR